MEIVLCSVSAIEETSSNTMSVLQLKKVRELSMRVEEQFVDRIPQLVARILSL